MKKSLVNVILVVVFTTITIVLIAVFEEPSELQSMAVGMHAAYLIPAVFCVFLFWMIDAFLLYRMVAMIAGKMSFGRLMPISMAVHFFNAITPFSSGGQPAMIYLLKNRGLSLGQATGLVVLKSFIFQSSLFMVVILALFGNFQFFNTHVTGFIPLFIVGCVTNVLMLLFYGMFFNKWLMTKVLYGACALFSKLGFRKKVEAFRSKIDYEIDVMRSVMKSLQKKRGNIVRLVLLSVVKITALCSVIYFVHESVENTTANFFNMLTAQYMVTLISGLVPLPGASGGAEGVAYLFFAPFFRSSSMLGIVLLWRLITYYSGLIVGGFFTIFSKENPIQNEH